MNDIGLKKTMSNHQEKMNCEVTKVINPIHYDWRDYSEKELEVLLKKLGGICRDETSLLRKNSLSDVEVGMTRIRASGIFIMVIGALKAALWL